jgi:nucleoside-diphosphate-sugar epimerase
MTKRILVAGAAGMVGQNLVPLLRARGDAVVALDKHPENLALLERLNPGVETVLTDLSEPGDWMDRFAGVDAVVDSKAQIAAQDPAVFERNNVTAQVRILDACRRGRVAHLVHLSSSVVLSAARDPYADSKRRAEGLVRRDGVPFTTLRPPLMFGCFDVKHLGYILRVLERTPLLPVPGSGRYVRQPLFVDDLCRVILACLDRPPSGAAHDVIGHERLAFIEILRTMARERGLRRLILPVPMPVFSLALRLHGRLTARPAFIQDQLDSLTAGDEFAVGRWTEEFGVEYTPFVAALRRTYASPCFRHTRQMRSPH